jgi:hypothetical protein
MWRPSIIDVGWINLHSLPLFGMIAEFSSHLIQNANLRVCHKTIEASDLIISMRHSRKLSWKNMARSLLQIRKSKPSGKKTCNQDVGDTQRLSYSMRLIFRSISQY